MGVSEMCTFILTGTKISNFAKFWFRGSARSCRISFHTVKYLIAGYFQGLYFEVFQGFIFHEFGNS